MGPEIAALQDVTLCCTNTDAFCVTLINSAEEQQIVEAVQSEAQRWAVRQTINIKHPLTGQTQEAQYHHELQGQRGCLNASLYAAMHCLVRKLSTYKVNTQTKAHKDTQHVRLPRGFLKSFFVTPLWPTEPSSSVLC